MQSKKLDCIFFISIGVKEKIMGTVITIILVGIVLALGVKVISFSWSGIKLALKAGVTIGGLFLIVWVLFSSKEPGKNGLTVGENAVAATTVMKTKEAVDAVKSLGKAIVKNETKDLLGDDYEERFDFDKGKELMKEELKELVAGGIHTEDEAYERLDSLSAIYGNDFRQFVDNAE